MPSLDSTFLNLLKGYTPEYSIFVETGTYLGGTIFAMEPYFDRLYTIELQEQFYKSAKAKYNGHKIQFLLGDSSIVLAGILPTIQMPTVFFLVGHWSSGDTAKGLKDCPLVEELTLINTLLTGPAIIIVDDCRLFGKGPLNGNNEDWTDISETNIVNCVKKRLTDMYYLDSDHAKNDRMILHIKALNTV
jgi:hypothetical protein